MKIKAYRGAYFYKRALLFSILCAVLAIYFDLKIISAIFSLVATRAFIYYEARTNNELRRVHLKLVESAYGHLHNLSSTITTDDPIRRSAWKVFCLHVGEHLRGWPDEVDTSFIRVHAPLYYQYVTEG